MPRRNLPPVAVAPVAALVAPPPPSPLIITLRKDWRWAAISQFIWTFSDAFGLIDWDIEDLEADLDGDEQQMLPDLLAKMLFALTYNRQINRSNVFENLRKVYLRRVPDVTPFGTLEEPVEWATFGLGQKVQIIHELCEWQMENPARFRALLKTEDEEATWRVDPLGWDKLGNTYYLFDDNRLWIQRVPPVPPRQPKKTSLKAKRAERALRKTKPPPKTSHKKREAKPPSDTSSPVSSPPPAKVEESVSGTRRRTQVAFFGNLTPTAAALKRGGNAGTPSGSRGTRSSSRLHGETLLAAQETPSKTRVKLDESPSKSTPLPRGTRVSRRLRDVEDEWQQVPDEWLADEPDRNPNASKGKAVNGKARAKKMEEDEESELSELTDEEEHEAKVEASRALETPTKEERQEGASEGALTPLPDDDAMDEDKKMPIGDDEKPSKAEQPMDDPVEEEPIEEDGEADEEEDEVKLAAKQAKELPEGFVEWEAVCVTLYDWRTFPEQFANSRDADEKALYQLLSVEVGPTIIDVLVAKEQERIKQEAVLNRKRSSRIATKELEKEELMRRQNAEREMEGRMQSQRLQEKRIAKEETEAVSKEKAREERLREREERAAAREEIRVWEEKEREREEQRGESEVSESSRKRRRGEGKKSNASEIVAPKKAGSSGSQERWEVACEVCKKTGWNIDEDDDLVCCDDCGRWQHTECHDRLDRRQGRPARNWDKVDFKCQECCERAARKKQRIAAASQPNGQMPRHPTANGHVYDASMARPSGPPQGVQQYHTLPQNAQQLPLGYPAPYPGQPHAERSLPHQSPTGQPGMLPYAQQPHHGQRAVPHGSQHPFAPDPRKPVLPSIAQATGYVNGHPGAQHVQPHMQNHQVVPRPVVSPSQHLSHPHVSPPHPQQMPHQSVPHPSLGPGSFPPAHVHPAQARPHSSMPPQHRHPGHAPYPTYPPQQAPQHSPVHSQSRLGLSPPHPQQWSPHAHPPPLHPAYAPHPGHPAQPTHAGHHSQPSPSRHVGPPGYPAGQVSPYPNHQQPAMVGLPGMQGGYPPQQRRPSAGVEGRQ